MHADIYVINTGIIDVNTSWWRELISLFIKEGSDFEISHWKEDKDTIDKALKFGDLVKESRTEYLIAGKVTKDLIKNLMDFKPYFSSEIFSSIFQEFFTINIEYTGGTSLADGQFRQTKVSSAHHGTEIYLSSLSDYEVEKLIEIFTPIKEYFIIRFDDFEL